MSDHNHDFSTVLELPNNHNQWIEICSICEKSKETLVDERMEQIEGAIFELNEALLKYARDMQIQALKFRAFVDMVQAYAKAANEDIDIFNNIEKDPNEIQTDDGDVPSGG